MRNKIMIMGLLCALLVGLVPPSSARAEEAKVIPAGTYTFFDEPLNNVPDELVGVYVPIKFYYMYQGQNDKIGIKIDTSGSELGLYYYRKSASGSASGERRCFVLDGVYSWYDIPEAKQITVVEDAEVPSVFFDWFKLNVSDPEGHLTDSYMFDEWCADAGLNCSASSNESDSVVPFWYEPDNYNYIVRKTLTASSTSGVYQVTMLQKTDGAHYPYCFEVNSIGYLGIAGAFSDTSAFTVRNFNYDSEGSGWKLVEKYDVSTLPFDNANVNFTDDVVFIYSDCDIYADREATAIWKSASTEYYNVDVPGVEIPTMPMPTPSLDSVDDFVDTAKGLLEMISFVPLMIGAVFGFLPSWCLAVVGISFSLLIALVIYKLARG